MSVHGDTNFLGNLTGLEYDIEHEKLEIIKKHISNFFEFLPNQEMISRLQQALKRREKISGLIWFHLGAFGEIGSSRAFFHDLAYAVIALMVNDKRRSYHMKSPVKNFLEQSLSTVNNT